MWVEARDSAEQLIDGTQDSPWTQLPSPTVSGVEFETSWPKKLPALSRCNFYFPQFSTLRRALFITWFQLRKDVDGSQIYIFSLLIMSPVVSPRHILLKMETVKGWEENQCFSPFSIQMATLSQHFHCSSWHTVLALVPWL